MIASILLAMVILVFVVKYLLEAFLLSDKDALEARYRLLDSETTPSCVISPIYRALGDLFDSVDDLEDLLRSSKTTVHATYRAWANVPDY